MKNSTGIPALDRLIRTVLQFIVSAGFTTAVAALSDGLTPTQATLVLLGSQMVVTFAQNTLEDMNVLPPILKGSSEAEFAQQLTIPKGGTAPVLPPGG